MTGEGGVVIAAAHVTGMTNSKHQPADMPANDDSTTAAISNDISTRFNPAGGWDERRFHPDGISFWRNGERHRSDGFAVEREGAREVWLFGHYVLTPDFREDETLGFGGQSASGHLSWLDADGAVRAVTVTTASGVREARWFNALGSPEEHWRGKYHVSRILTTGERRFYRQAARSDKPALHRVDGAAIEDAGNPVRSTWCVNGARVHGPFELLIRQTAMAQMALEHRRPMVQLTLTEVEKSRLRFTVINHPDSVLATDVAIAFPDEYVAAIEYLSRLSGGPLGR